MGTRPDCIGSNSQLVPMISLPDGWPHGRGECSVCHGFYTPKDDGTLRRHKPHLNDNEYQATRRAKLTALRPT